jgi:hypothetical protein
MLTNADGCRLICDAVLSQTLGSFVCPGERELGSYGSTEKDEGEGRQQHAGGGMTWSVSHLAALTALQRTCSSVLMVGCGRTGYGGYKTDQRLGSGCDEPSCGPGRPSNIHQLPAHLRWELQG